MKLEYVLILIIAVAVGVAVGLLGRPHDQNLSTAKGILESVSPSQSLSLAEKSNRYEKFHEIENPGGFVNTNGLPVTIAQYVGKKVIMLDVMTYSCINCQRTFPYANKWYEEYQDKGLIIIGIHTPEFAFEHNIDNVTEAMHKFGIKFPIVLDNDYGTWNAYGNNYWPRKYLIDIDGYVVYDHIGEGEYDKTEAKIVELLNERAKKIGESEVKMGNNIISEGNSNLGQVFADKSPETYLGSARSLYDVSKSNVCVTSTCEYKVPEEIPSNRFAIKGTWLKTPEYIELKKSPGSIVYHFNAQKVHLVAQASTPVSAEIYLDGKLISASNSGVDVVNSFVTFHDAQLYTLVDLDNVEEHILEIKIKDSGLQAYAFTFS